MLSFLLLKQIIFRNRLILSSIVSNFVLSVDEFIRICSDPYPPMFYKFLFGWANESLHRVVVR